MFIFRLIFPQIIFYGIVINFGGYQIFFVDVIVASFQPQNRIDLLVDNLPFILVSHDGLRIS